jgi:hypothetical protein
MFTPAIVIVIVMQEARDKELQSKERRIAELQAERAAAKQMVEEEKARNHRLQLELESCLCE